MSVQQRLGLAASSGCKTSLRSMVVPYSSRSANVGKLSRSWLSHGVTQSLSTAESNVNSAQSWQVFDNGNSQNTGRFLGLAASAITALIWNTAAAEKDGGAEEQGSKNEEFHPAESIAKGKLESYKLAQYFDHTLLKPDATPQDIETLCQEAIDYGFYSVCVNSCHVNTARRYLEEHEGGDAVGITAVVGFPLGASQSSVKAYEAETAIQDGAEEIDMVIPVGYLKTAPTPSKLAQGQKPDHSGISYIIRDISSVASTVKRYDECKLKVILETALLSKEEIELGVFLAGTSGADFVKTSTGFSKGGATVEDVRLMAEHAKSAGGMEVKASGGIKTLMDAALMIQAGATRLGASSGVSIVEEARRLEKLEKESKSNE
eukprot:gb/GECG01009047.1/.p1 GENE.gb/GECG01009047.1/~~gb/GECG01009047.1/.p1  ORF type:complete len:376 (+),score=49.69 gb/GECG01009047.1/:1-1128(+)